MQHFQPILIAIGILAIAGVLIHGFLLNRKNKLALLAEKEEQYDEQEEDETLDGEKKQSSSSFNRDRDFDAMAFSSHLSEDKDDTKVIDFSLEQPQAGEDHEPVMFEQEKVQAIDSLDTEITTQAETNNINHDHQSVADVELENAPDAQLSEAAKTPAPVELFIFNIAAKQGQRLGGHELLQFFLTSGFRYGDMNIFHRHEHSDGTGEILFSIANMMAPGTFDLDYMEQFNSPGISFFFTAPNDKISVNKSFDMMLRAVEQAAEEFDCEVLNEDREKFTPEQYIQYRQRLQKYQ